MRDSGNKPLENCEIRRSARSKPSSTVFYNTSAIATSGNKQFSSRSIKISSSNLGAKFVRLKFRATCLPRYRELVSPLIATHTLLEGC